MKRINRIVISLFTFISLISVSIQVSAMENKKAETNKLDDNVRVKIEKFIEKQMDSGKIMGLSVAIVQGDKTLYQKGIGYSDYESKNPVTSNTLFELASNTKAFTALGVLNLDREGLIDIDDPVDKYIPWFKMKYKNKVEKITIKDLLFQTSGIPENTIGRIPVSDDRNSIEKTVRNLMNVELDYEPGSIFQYATINYDVLGLIIEKASGKPYEDYMQEKVLNQLGLNNTYLYKSDAMKKDLAQGYKLGFLKPRKYDAPTYRGNKPAAYIISNSEDMAKWLKIQLGTSSENKFNTGLISYSHIPRISNIDYKKFYACGWYGMRKDDLVIYHPGSNPNYSSFILFDPAKELGVAVLANSNSSYVSSIADGIYALLQGKAYNANVNDSNKLIDIVCVIVIFIEGLVLIALLSLIIRILIQIAKKERKFYINDGRTISKIIFRFVIAVILSYLLYIIPVIYSNGTWEFIFVWIPISLKALVYLTYVIIVVAYIKHVLSLSVKSNNETY
jgi:CubicO group peptidase (beta-lactamase class C family)